MLSGISAVYGLITGLGGALSPPDVDSGYVDSLLSKLSEFDFPEELKESIQAYYVNLSIQFGNLSAANFLFYGIQLVGVILMFQLNRIGFILYVGAQLGLAFAPLIFGGSNDFAVLVLIMALLWSGAWIAAYATQLKYFRNWRR